MFPSRSRSLNSGSGAVSLQLMVKHRLTSAYSIGRKKRNGRKKMQTREGKSQNPLGWGEVNLFPSYGWVIPLSTLHIKVFNNFCPRLTSCTFGSYGASLVWSRQPFDLIRSSSSKIFGKISDKERIRHESFCGFLAFFSRKIWANEIFCSKRKPRATVELILVADSWNWIKWEPKKEEGHDFFFW